MLYFFLSCLRHGGRLAIIRYICIYGEKSKLQDKEVVSISTYEELSLILGVAMLIVVILSLNRKK